MPKVDEKAFVTKPYGTAVNMVERDGTTPAPTPTEDETDWALMWQWGGMYGISIDR